MDKTVGTPSTVAPYIIWCRALFMNPSSPSTMLCTIYENPVPQYNVVTKRRRCIAIWHYYLQHCTGERGSRGVPTSFVQDCLSLRKSQVRAKDGIFLDCAQGESSWGLITTYDVISKMLRSLCITNRHYSLGALLRNLTNHSKGGPLRKPGVHCVQQK